MRETFAGNGGFEGYSAAQTAGTFEGALGNGGFQSDGSDETRPFAYLNFILFDDNLQMLDAGWQRVPVEAGFDVGEEGLPGMHRKVEFPDPITASSTGYIYIWVSNESENTAVWFDDLKITHSTSLVTQATDYGVWGDVLREQKTDPSAFYRYGYQGQFSERDSLTGWNHFELREFDPIVGRWMSKDPYRQFWSPYSGMGNDPVNYADPNGAYTKFGAWCRNGFSMDGVQQEGGEWGFLTTSADGGFVPHYGDERSGLFPKQAPWYSQAWNAYWNKWHETAVVFNMDDDPNAEGWNSAPVRGLIQDNLTIEINAGAALGDGANGQYTLNLLTRGPEAGFFITQTVQESAGGGSSYGVSFGQYHYNGPLNTMTRSSVEGRTETYSAGCHAGGGSVSLGYDNNGRAVWSGVSAGLGKTLGVIKNTGETTIILGNK